MMLRAIAAFAGILAGAVPALAGPCTQQIAEAQATFDARIHQVALIGPTATESTGAKLHRQPTAASLAGAEQQAVTMTAEKQKEFQDAIGRARAADGVGDAAGCEKGLAEARATLAP